MQGGAQEAGVSAGGGSPQGTHGLPLSPWNPGHTCGWVPTPMLQPQSFSEFLQFAAFDSVQYLNF